VYIKYLITTAKQLVSMYYNI